MAELVFHRTCNYWIDAGIVGLYDTFNKPVPNSEGIGMWPETIKCHTDVDISLSSDQLVIKGEEDQIDRALSWALERIRTTLYDVSSEKQIASPEKDGRIKQMSTLAGEVVATGKQAEFTYFRKALIDSIGKTNIFLPLKEKNSKATFSCVFCGGPVDVKLSLKKAEEIFIGETKKSTPFIEGNNSNLCFHSHHNGSKKCWQCGYVTFFAPLLLFYRRVIVSGNNKDTYYMLPYVPGNLKATYVLYRSLSGKRGLAKAIGSDHTEINYESSFKLMPRGIPTFTLTFYYDLFDRLLPKSSVNLLKTTQDIGLIDDRSAVFQTAIFLKRDSGPKTFIMRETTIDRSAYFIKLYSYLAKHLGGGNEGKLSDGLQSLIGRSAGKREHMQRVSVIKASQAMTEGKPIYKYLLPILSSDLKEKTNYVQGSYQITSLFQKYDQWIFNKEDRIMADIVKNANKAGWSLSQAFWRHSEWKDDEKENFIRRYYYSIERASSPVKFLENVRHAYMRVKQEIPEMSFHKNEDDSNDIREDIKKFEVYRVYFLAGMLNGLLDKKNTAKSLGTEGDVQKEETNNGN